MTDPLSVAASVSGLVTIAGQLYTILSDFVSSAIDAPESARAALAAVDDMRMVLVSVKNVMDRLSVLPRHRKEMIHIRPLVVTFRNAIIHLSELEAVVNRAAGPGGQCSGFDRLNWAMDEDKVTRSVEGLNSQKLSMSLMLNILQCDSDIEAEEKVKALEEKVQKMSDQINQNNALLQRLFALNIGRDPEFSSFRFLDDDQTITQRDLDNIPDVEDSVQSESAAGIDIPRRSFEFTLEQTRVYMRVQLNECDASFATEDRGSKAWSMLSGLSLNDISVVSVLALPISLEEINEIGPKLTFARIISESEEAPSSNNPEKSIRRGLASEITTPAPVPPSYANPVQELRSYAYGPYAYDGPTTGASELPMTLQPTTTFEPRKPRTRVEKMPVYRFVVLGDGGAGKTALTLQFTLGHFVETYDPTIEDSYRKQCTVDGKKCMIEVLDTAGHEEYTTLRDQWIREGEAFLLVYSVTDRSGFERIRYFYKQVERVKLHSALFDLSRQRPGQVVVESSAMDDFLARITLVGNDIDRITEREVSCAEGMELAKELGCAFQEVSSRNCINIEKTFYDQVRTLRQLRRAGYDDDSDDEVRSLTETQKAIRAKFRPRRRPLFGLILRKR